MLLGTRAHHASMTNLKSEIDTKIERILAMVRNGRGRDANRKVNLNRTIGVQTYYHASTLKDNDSTILNSGGKEVEVIDFSDISGIKERSGQRQLHYGKAYTPKNKMYTPSSHHKVARKLDESREEHMQGTDRSNASSRVDLHNKQFEEHIRRTKNSSMILKHKKNQPIAVDVYANLMQEIQGRKTEKRQQLPLTNFVRDRLLKRVLDISQKQEMVDP